jgi:hypothetical protein
VYINADLVEGADVDATKEFYSEFGATTGTTLRLVKPWRGSRRVIIGDAWFGSKKTCEELAEFGFRGILSLKTAHRGYPKKYMLSKIPNRGDVYAMETKVNLGYEGEGEELSIYAAGHRDKRPMLLVSTCGLLVDGP